MKKVIGLVAGALFVCTLFFNVSLIQNVDGDSSLSLETLQSAQAQDGESGCEYCHSDDHTNGGYDDDPAYCEGYTDCYEETAWGYAPGDNTSILPYTYYTGKIVCVEVGCGN